MPADAESGPLRVLVVEDDYLIALDMERMLERLGCRVVGLAPTVARARALLARERPDLVLLDVNLDGERSTPIAEALRRDGISFILATGYDETQLGEAVLAGAPRLNKPVDLDALRHALAAHDGADRPAAGAGD